MPRTRRIRPDTTTWTTAVFAGVYWALLLAAVVCNLLDDQGALTGIFGAAFGTLAFTVTAWGLYRQDRRLAARYPEAYAPRRSRLR